jgi:hypothetical protein
METKFYYSLVSRCERKPYIQLHTVRDAVTYALYVLTWGIGTLLTKWHNNRGRISLYLVPCKVTPSIFNIVYVPCSRLFLNIYANNCSWWNKYCATNVLLVTEENGFDLDTMDRVLYLRASLAVKYTCSVTSTILAEYCSFFNKCD